MMHINKKILLIYPEYPDTFWSFKHALKFVSKKAAFPPLGLLTVAAMLPDEWELKLVDMNTGRLSDKDIKWADMVFISAMVVQRDSARNRDQALQEAGCNGGGGRPAFHHAAPGLPLRGPFRTERGRGHPAPLPGGPGKRLPAKNVFFESPP